MSPDNTDDLIELAAQLRCPHGERGLAIAHNMDFTNANIICKTIDSLEIVDNDTILEIGPGNGNHVRKIIKKTEGIHYHGIDISADMVSEAEKLNRDISNVNFMLTDGRHVPFTDNMFRKGFTTNTIYFWEDPRQYAADIYRVMQPGGLFSIGFIPKRVMQCIPFTKYGFTLYDEASVAALLKDAGFAILSEITEKEMIKGPSGDDIEREFVIITAGK